MKKLNVVILRLVSNDRNENAVDGVRGCPVVSVNAENVKMFINPILTMNKAAFTALIIDASNINRVSFLRTKGDKAHVSDPLHLIHLMTNSNATKRPR